MSSQKARPCAYFPVESLPKLCDGTSPIIMTEGEKKALALAQLGLAAIGIGGIWCGCKKQSDELIDDLEAIDWTNRVAHIVFDYDAKPETRRMSMPLAADSQGAEEGGSKRSLCC